ncbi:hypothetical protein [Verminephrobacter aporrectodeae]|nr:hypothetical protein [Verminephrobacter aporrectodeae]
MIEVQNGDENTVARYGYDPMNRCIWKEQYRDKTGQLLAPAMRTYSLYAGGEMLAKATQTLEIPADQSISASHAPGIFIFQRPG